jgi:hypothetical protein
LASAAIKLRDLLHPGLGLPSSERECDIPSLQQILAFLEAEVERRPVDNIDPLLPTIAERERLVSAINESPATDEFIDRTGEIIDALADKIAATAATSAEGIRRSGQVVGRRP